MCVNQLPGFCVKVITGFAADRLFNTSFMGQTGESSFFVEKKKFRIASPPPGLMALCYRAGFSTASGLVPCRKNYTRAQKVVVLNSGTVTGLAADAETLGGTNRQADHPLRNLPPRYCVDPDGYAPRRCSRRGRSPARGVTWGRG